MENWQWHMAGSNFILFIGGRTGHFFGIAVIASQPSSDPDLSCVLRDGAMERRVGSGRIRIICLV